MINMVGIYSLRCKLTSLAMIMTGHTAAICMTDPAAPAPGRGCTVVCPRPTRGFHHSCRLIFCRLANYSDCALNKKHGDYDCAYPGQWAVGARRGRRCRSRSYSCGVAAQENDDHEQQAAACTASTRTPQPLVHTARVCGPTCGRIRGLKNYIKA